MVHCYSTRGHREEPRGGGDIQKSKKKITTLKQKGTFSLDLLPVNNVPAINSEKNKQTKNNKRSRLFFPHWSRVDGPRPDLPRWVLVWICFCVLIAREWAILMTK